MKLVHTVAEARAARAAFPTLGLVPTMGALHEGHLTLVRQAREACGAVAVSIFVNPTQFNEGADFDRYPRTLKRDLELLEPTGCDLVFAPDAAAMYPPGFASSIEVGPVSAPLEGAMRPGHFAGVATVVCKLLNIVQPTRAYFGQKDAQQLAVIRRMAADLDLPFEIVAVPTVREADGLALSSRNVHLTPQERAQAPALHRALQLAKAAWGGGERDGDQLRAAMKAVLAGASLGRVEYASIADPLTLLELDEVGDAGALASLAVRFGDTRLIDNLVLGGPD
ncbi:MAG: panC [Caulobacter sp.]|nr:panC [Caulobacter sp.]